MSNYNYINLREKPNIKNKAAHWFNDKWNVPVKAYIECMDDYINKKTELGWYLCLLEDNIVAGLGIIENDFHKRVDLSPNICAIYTEKNHRNKGLAGNLLNIAIDDMKNKSISPLYLITNHTSFYERYGWRFLEMVETDSGEMIRMYIHD